MTAYSKARSALWRVPIGLQLSALYAVLLVSTLTLLGWVLYVQLDNFLVQDTASRLQQTTEPLTRGDAIFRQREFRDQGSRERPMPIPGVVTDPAGERFFHGPPPEVLAGALVRRLASRDLTAALLDAQGTVITSSLVLENNSPQLVSAQPSQEMKVTTNGSSSRWIVRGASGERLLVVVQLLTVPAYDRYPQSQFFIEQVTSLAAADSFLSRLRLYIIFGILVGTLIGVFAGLALTRAVLRPLDRMVSTAEAIASGDLKRRLRLPHGDNEVARLGSAFDHMVDRLGATLEAQKRFVADASHELRTPLTSLEGLSEMLMIGADRGDGRVVQRSVRAIHSELGRLSRLVTDLLTLSRLDSPAMPGSVSQVNGGALLEEVAIQMAPLADAQGVRIALEISEKVIVLGEADRLKQVLINLLDNAIRYSPEGGEVRLLAYADRERRQAALEIHDRGPGIALEDQPHIFDRFYRGDPSRTRATGSSGLGLSIARAIVEQHGGSISVRSTPGEGAHFTVSLPLAAGQPHPAPEAQKVPQLTA